MTAVPMSMGTNAPPPVKTAEPAKLDHHEKTRLRAAAFRATRLYPGVVGELISKEMLTWEEFGFRFDQVGMMARLVDHVLKTPLARPEPPENVPVLGYRSAV